MRIFNIVAQYLRYIEIAILRKINFYDLRIIVPGTNGKDECISMSVADARDAQNILTIASKLVKDASVIFMVYKITNKTIVNF